MCHVDATRNELKQLKVWVERDSTHALCSRIADAVLVSALPKYVGSWRQDCVAELNPLRANKKSSIATTAIPQATPMLANDPAETMIRVESHGAGKI